MGVSKLIEIVQTLTPGVEVLLLHRKKKLVKLHPKTYTSIKPGQKERRVGYIKTDAQIDLSIFFHMERIKGRNERPSWPTYDCPAFREGRKRSSD